MDNLYICIFTHIKDMFPMEKHIDHSGDRMVMLYALTKLYKGLQTSY